MSRFGLSMVAYGQQTRRVAPMAPPQTEVEVEETYDIYDLNGNVIGEETRLVKKMTSNDDVNIIGSNNQIPIQTSSTQQLPKGSFSPNKSCSLPAVHGGLLV